ncbi:hypothetical protein [Aureliella helgolandensis]|uniref:hypothetical protein n=1 Tax=Aureliella helgolandensis TaxID=2527968 RepID=UPI0011A78B94|nr:hypothetical protein [Aureliella helgolandensis]
MTRKTPTTDASESTGEHHCVKALPGERMKKETPKTGAGDAPQDTQDDIAGWYRLMHGIGKHR